MVLFARSFNDSHACGHAWATYQRKNSVPPPPPRPDAPAGSEPPSECSAPPTRKARRRIRAPAGEEDMPEQQDGLGDASGVPVAGLALPAQAGQARCWAVLNERISTVHPVILPRDVYTECGWSFQGRGVVVGLSTLRGQGFHQCGRCFHARGILA